MVFNNRKPTICLLENLITAWMDFSGGQMDFQTENSWGIALVPG